MVKRTKVSNFEEGEKPKFGGTFFKPLPPCSCGQPQIAAVRIKGGLLPRCKACYVAWWTPEHIRGDHLK